ncbi:cytochrome-c peroxidase [Nitrincola alkalisediminis]|uniref:cytochrome-c peroxidase n=1 Tax=Nitrincola alkalisediminis TaxID=1366656 RepID=UPI001CA9DC9E|nr:cytochrome-c peroxidase [Nitrincola alkalisediminis]
MKYTLIRMLKMAFIGLLLSMPFQVNAQSFDAEKAELGQRLFFDPNLSRNRTQSCATCHAPSTAFSDSRPNLTDSAASLGDDNQSFGDRNAPMVTYAAQTPDFHRNAQGIYVGGFFWDGRAANLAEQAKGPPLNPIEMGMPDEESVIERILENPIYPPLFKALYGEPIFENTQAAYNAMADALAHFEKTELFNPFDSKYDRYLQGKAQLTPEEELGMTLFFSQQFTNCNLCHQLNPLPGREKEVFSNFEYHNIGVPVNAKLREINGVMDNDVGLFAHPEVDDPSSIGKFKTPSLRNVAVTGPYMHNGVFQDLRTVILFYNQYNSRSAKMRINPETGLEWEAPEIPENISLTELQTGPALDDKRVDALVAFLKTLTDARFEHLLNASTD